MKIETAVGLYQVVVVLFPILAYHLFFTEKQSERKRPHSKLTIILILMVILSMSFPVRVSNGFIYDFREIPFLISFIYCGPLPGLLLTLILLTYRFILGGVGFYVVLFNYSITCVIFLLLRKQIAYYRRKVKLVFASIIFWLNTTIVIFTLFTTNHVEQIKFMLGFYTLTWICLLMIILVIENADHQIEMRMRMQRDEKLNVVSQLAASVAHEVRNPMTTVRGFLQLLSDDQNLQSYQKNYIDIAINELDHAQNIINDYLSLARPNLEGLKPINISEEVKKTIALMTSYSNIQNISIETNIQDSLFINGNKDEVKQVLVNIIKNGIEAMNHGGTLTINTFEKDGFITIEIKDSGKGMTKRQLNRLGTPFYTTKEKGTGVGLTISFQLIQSMKGKVMIESEEGKGTLFTIQFPSIPK